VVTGFLGSGKTTLLNRLLAGANGRRLAVIVNEFGALSIDGRLLRGAGGDVIELANGCVCCVSHGDLMRSVAALAERQPRPDWIVVETSGLADPRPVVQSLQRPGMLPLVRLDAVVTVVDALEFDRNLERAEAAHNQIVEGDVLLVNKCDLVTPEVAGLVERAIRTLNPAGRVVRCVNAAVEVDLLLDAGPRAPHPAAAALAHGHDAGLTSASLRSVRPVSPQPFAALLDRLPPGVFRGKGVFHIAGSDDRLVFHQVGERRSIVPAGTWADGEPRATELVFIGRDFSREALLDDLGACLEH
jgi:G3E family GTPase